MSYFITQAFLIAFTSEFIAKLVYKYEHNWDMRGYVNFTLAVSPQEGWLDDNKPECRLVNIRAPWKKTETDFFINIDLCIRPLSDYFFIFLGTLLDYN